MVSFVHDGSFIPNAPVKDEDSTVDYGCDWSAWLSVGEIITSSAWEIEPATDLWIESESNTTTATSVFLSNGTTGITYTLTNRITTNQNRIEDRSMLIECKQK